MDKIPPRTYEIQAGYILGLQAPQDWVDWAVEAITVGYDSRNLRILAGLQPPFDWNEINLLTNKSLAELNVVPLKRENCIPHYIAPILRRTSNHELTQKESLTKLRDLYLATNHEKSLTDFYLLYHALDDLETSEAQWYWEGANQTNIHKIIDDYFTNWLKNYGPTTPA